MPPITMFITNKNAKPIPRPFKHIIICFVFCFKLNPQTISSCILQNTKYIKNNIIRALGKTNIKTDSIPQNLFPTMEKHDILPKIYPKKKIMPKSKNPNHFFHADKKQHIMLNNNIAEYTHKLLNGLNSFEIIKTNEPVYSDSAFIAMIMPTTKPAKNKDSKSTSSFLCLFTKNFKSFGIK